MATNEQPEECKEESCCATESEQPEAAAAPLSASEEAEEYKTKYLRNLAEMENARKRMQRERLELIKFANEQLILDLLNPLDQMEQALAFAEQASAEVSNWAMGFKMILAQLEAAIKSAGAESFEAHGQLFDPHLHEAIEATEDPKLEPGTIVKQHCKGYRMGERVIRPARVQVVRATDSPQNVNEERQDG